MSKCLQFGGFSLYPDERMVKCGKDELDIRNTAFDLLHLLLQHPKTLVKKDTILKKVWPDKIVEEANIPVCINKIREQLRDPAKEPRIIKTVWRQGYKLLVDVKEVDGEAEQFNTRSDTGGTLAQNEVAPIIKALDNIESALAEVRKQVADLQQDNMTSKKLNEEYEHRLEYNTEQLEITVDINKYDGSCHTRWVWTNVKRKRHIPEIAYVFGTLKFSAPGCSYSKYPVLSANSRADYNLKLTKKTRNFCEFCIHSKAPTNILNYTYVADAKCAFLMTEDKLANQPYDYEWFGYQVKDAIKTLVIHILFPDFYIPTDCHPHVDLGLSLLHITDDGEIKRIIDEGGFSVKNNGSITMTVINPKINFRYCVRWRPLPSAVVRTLKQRQQK
jgi:DNA-binding winged helix-turn-helix (wHTH) protein